MELRKVFARNLKHWRAEGGLSQEALALRAGIDRTYISALERGIYSASIDTIAKLATVLKVGPAILLARRQQG